jgi:hypothetical protein
MCMYVYVCVCMCVCLCDTVWACTHTVYVVGLCVHRSRVFGAQGVAAAFHAAASYKNKDKRKHMARCHIMFREVKIDHVQAAATKKKIGAQLVSADLDKGHMGVKGLLYFDFSVKDKDGAVVHMPGYARVREYADPAKVGNRSRVYTWRKDLAALMCQGCSDAMGGPVLLEVSGCTKKLCFVAERERKEMEARAAERQHDEGPMYAREHVLAEKQQEVEGDGRVDGDVQEELEPHMPMFETKQETREVRAVHGLEVGCGGKADKQALWFYVPADKKDKNNTKRKGWWLYQQPGAPGRYYIGPLADVQRTVKVHVEDIATFPAFPFDCTHQLHPTTRVLMPETVRCITSRALFEEERSVARGGKQIEEADVPGAQAQVVVPIPKRARKKRTAPTAAVVEKQPRKRRSRRGS